MPRNRRLRDYLMRRDERRSGRRDYERGGQRDMVAMDYARGMRGRDGHYPMVQGYMPIEAMGRFTGYWGEPESDYARGGRGGGRGRDYNADYGYDYNYDMGYDYAHRGGRRDYGYDMAGDMGENLTREELEHWCKKMMLELDEREKQMFSKDAILQRAKSIGIQFDKFSEMEFYVNVVKNYTDHKKTIGENPDMAIKLSNDDFNDKDGEYKGSEWLAVYFDTFVKQD